MRNARAQFDPMTTKQFLNTRASQKKLDLGGRKPFYIDVDRFRGANIKNPLVL